MICIIRIKRLMCKMLSQAMWTGLTRNVRKRINIYTVCTAQSNQVKLYFGLPNIVFPKSQKTFSGLKKKKSGIFPCSFTTFWGQTKTGGGRGPSSTFITTTCTLSTTYFGTWTTRMSVTNILLRPVCNQRQHKAIMTGSALKERKKEGKKNSRGGRKSKH